ncbi:uncharacterized protein LOC105662250 isoform X2 [Megachile rotundata]|uniref:uncharacterized protein LOC105662250 isoform X2 n=1 Tax=Megachile rotundata TaxID=143995 RepID=UPI003FD55962
MKCKSQLTCIQRCAINSRMAVKSARNSKIVDQLNEGDQLRTTRNTSEQSRSFFTDGVHSFSTVITRTLVSRATARATLSAACGAFSSNVQYEEAGNDVQGKTQ